MSRYIDAEKIEQIFKSKIPFKYLMASNYDTAVENAFKIVDTLNAEISTADVEEVRHGYDVAEYPSKFKCSLCGWCCWDIYDETTVTYNYCPNCGAKMDGGNDK